MPWHAATKRMPVTSTSHIAWQATQPPSGCRPVPAGDAAALRLRDLLAINTVAATAAIPMLHRTGSAITLAAGGGKAAVCKAAPAGTTSAATTPTGPDSPIAAPTTPSGGPSNTLAINQSRGATPHHALPSNSRSAP